MNETDPRETDNHDRPPRDQQHADDDEPMVIFEFGVPAEGFVLAHALREFPDTTVEFEHIVPSDHHQMPYLWATAGVDPEFREAVAEDPHVTQITSVATFEGGALYGLEWELHDGGFLSWFAEHTDNTAVLEASATDNEWVLKLRFQTRENLAEFRAFADEQDIQLRVIRLYDLTRPKMGEYNISAKQREALLRALEMGHFAIPREATLEEIADSLDISARSVSERLRRGQTNLIRNTIPVGQPTGLGLDER